MIKTRKSSSLLTWIAICILILSISGGIFNIYVTRTISMDAEIINKLGIIRGSIQKLVKLELAGIESNELIADIETRISEFDEGKFRVFDEDNTIQDSISDLKETWSLLKNSIEAFRVSPSENKERLLQVSEYIWVKANIMVYSSQTSSEKKINQYRISFIFSLINLLLGVLIIYLIQRYVKRRLEHLVDRDVLTDLHNKRYFNEILQKEISKGTRYQTQFSLILFDIDHFKEVNDSHGHDVGDLFLKVFTGLIEMNIRKSDISARIGGDEFAIIAPETNIEKACELAEKLRSLVENHRFKKTEKTTISLGLTEYKKGDSFDSIFKRADNALYAAKTQGRNKCIKG